jgi:cytochrome P450
MSVDNRLDYILIVRAPPATQGARRCPGSRVSRNEALILMAQLILDWDISIPGVNNWREIDPVLETVNVPKLPKMSFEARK